MEAIERKIRKENKLSADNWTVCPKCKSDKKDIAEKARLEAEKSYGKITSTEFLSLINDISRKEEEVDGDEKEKTLREDYEIGIDEFGSFSIGYSASCSKCKLEYRYDYAISIPLINKSSKKRKES